MKLAEIVADVHEALQGLGYHTYDYAAPKQYSVPAAVIQLPDSVTYNGAFAGREIIELTVDLIFSRADAKDAWQRLASAVSTEPTTGVDVQPIKPALESFVGRWKKLAVRDVDAFGTVTTGNNAQGIAAQAHLIITANRPDSTPDEDIS